jgi:hypothetical protein
MRVGVEFAEWYHIHKDWGRKGHGMFQMPRKQTRQASEALSRV